MKSFPKISVIFFSHSDPSGAKRALDSVRKQAYPSNRVEIIDMDNDSHDNTREIVKRYTKRIYTWSKDGPKNRADAMRKATGDFIFMVLEDDMEFRGKNYFQKMLKPMLEDDRIVASFTREYPNDRQPWVTRLISYNPVQLDPLFEFLTPSISSTIVEKRNGYFVCNYVSSRIPPTTHMLFRKTMLKKTPVWLQKRDFDHDTVIKLIKSGYQLFAYVPNAGDYHYHAENLKELIGKRIRNLKNHYFPEQSSTEYKWFDEGNRLNFLKIVFWVLYVNLIFPELVRGIFRFFKYRDWVFFMQPVISIVATDSILFYFLINKSGRKIIYNLLRKLFF